MEYPKTEGISFSEAAEVKAAWKKVKGVITVQGPYYESTPVVELPPVAVPVEVKEIVYEGEEWYAPMTQDGDNLTASPYEQWGYELTEQSAIEAAARNHPGVLDVQEGVFRKTLTEGGESIDGTGHLNVIWDRPDDEDDALYFH